MNPLSLRYLELVALAYENLTVVCLHSALGDIIAQGSAHCLGDLPGLIGKSKSHALDDCMEAMNSIPCGSTEEAGLLPLLFVVACEAHSLDQMLRVMHRVDVLESNVGIGNIRCVQTLLQELWVRRLSSGQWDDWRSVLVTSKWDLIVS